MSDTCVRSNVVAPRWNGTRSAQPTIPCITSGRSVRSRSSSQLLRSSGKPEAATSVTPSRAPSFTRPLASVLTAKVKSSKSRCASTTFITKSGRGSPLRPSTSRNQPSALRPSSVACVWALGAILDRSRSNNSRESSIFAPVARLCTFARSHTCSSASRSGTAMSCTSSLSSESFRSRTSRLDSTPSKFFVLIVSTGSSSTDSDTGTPLATRIGRATMRAVSPARSASRSTNAPPASS